MKEKSNVKSDSLSQYPKTLKLPFAIGEIVYYVTPKCYFEMKVESYTFDGKLKICLVYHGGNEMMQNFSKWVLTEDIGKTVFSSYEAAKNMGQEEFK